MAEYINCSICNNILIFNREFINLHIEDLCVDCYIYKNPNEAKEEIGNKINLQMRKYYDTYYTYNYNNGMNEIFDNLNKLLINGSRKKRSKKSSKK